MHVAEDRRDAGSLSERIACGSDDRLGIELQPAYHALIDDRVRQPNEHNSEREIAALAASLEQE